MTTTEQTSWFFRRRKSHDRRNCSLEVRDITVTNDDNTVIVDDLTLDLKPGTKTCIVGSDPQAVDTLINAIVGESKIDSGTIRLNGQDLSDLTPEDIEAVAFVVPQDPPVIHGTIWSNITFGLSAVSRFQREWAAQLANVDAIARFLPDGMDTVISDGSDVGAIVLSVGQTRRIALARALLRNPSILILDNPTADMSSRDEQQFLRTVSEAIGGRTLLVASNRLAVARKADDVWVMENGALTNYDEDSTRGTVDDHSRLWDRTVNITNTTELRRCQDLRQLSSTSRVTSQSWGISVGDEIAPGFTASALINRTEHTDVWAAWSSKTEEPVKIKLPGQSPVSYHAYEQIQREFQMVRRLRHPGLGAARSMDLEAEMPHAVFEYLDSHSLETLVKRHGRGLEPLDVLFIGFELAGALHYLHNRGRVHLDLRARHVRTRSETIVISDFSSCRLIGSCLPGSAGSGNGHRGEHHMIAPEQRPGVAAHPKMDIFSLGAVLHYLAAGGIETEDSLSGKRLIPFAALIDTAPVTLTALVERMLAEDPADRPDAEEILSRFRQVIPTSMYRPRIVSLDDSPRPELALSNN